MIFRKKLLQTAIAALVLATLAIAWFSYSWSRGEAIEQLRERAEQRVDHFSLSVFAPTSKYAYLPTVVSEFRLVTDALKQPRDMQRILKANLLLERVNRETGAAVIYLMSREGLTVASSNWRDENSFVGNNYSYRPYFIDALRSGQGSFYGMGVTTGIPGYYLSHAVKENDTVLGVVVVKVDLHEIASGWEGDQHEVVVTDENGVVFVSSRDEWKYRPVQPLDEVTQERLRKTRQYETVLKEPLPIEVDEELAEGERIISVEQRHGNETDWVSYFVKSRPLPGSEWTINVLTPMKKINAEARKVAFLSIALVALLLLSSMYLIQIRNRNRERKESRLALEQALQALEKEHEALQSVTEELRRASITDPLTGAFNRRFFLDATVKMVSAANRHQRPLSIIAIDVDHFKRINDEHGHPAGDKVLQTLSDIYRQELREDDIFARFGGEEFVMALPNTDDRAAQGVAERLREKMMNHPIEVDGQALVVTVSSGISQHRLNEKTLQGAIKRADDALYEAKNGGRNRVVVL